MGRTKELFQENRLLIKTNVETLNYFIRTWHEFSCKAETPKELALNVQNSFSIECTEDNIMSAFEIDGEEEDIKLQIKHLGFIY